MVTVGGVLGSVRFGDVEGVETGRSDDDVECSASGETDPVGASGDSCSFSVWYYQGKQ